MSAHPVYTPGMDRTPRLSLTQVIVALEVGVLIPVLLSTAVGITTLVLGESSNPIVVGVLVISFTATAIGGVVAATVLLGKRARTARLQADLLANVSHDLRTPLSAIRLYAQTLQSGKLKDDPVRTEESLETIIRETAWLDTMVDRVLTWRAAEKDQDLLEMKAEPIREAVEDAVARFSNLVTPEEADFKVDLKSRRPVLHDRHGISTVVLNLLINAYKYTGNEKRISLSVEDREDQVVLVVQDNGIGIPARELRRIFGPFYRVDSRLRGQASGAGLGLAIVQHQVRGHRGRVTVESTEGEGSRFTVTLPAVKDESALA